MTSEVVVMNRLAVALAADSATTVTGAGSQKIWNSANKLFALSKTHPVGVMFFNDASILGVPWETIIKDYRSRLGCQAFDTLEEYGWDFISYLNGNRLLFPESLQKKYFLSGVRGLYDSYVSKANDEFISIVVDGKKTTRDEEFSKLVESVVAEWVQVEDLQTSSNHSSELILQAYGAEIDAEIEAATEGLTLTEDIKEKLRKIAVFSATKSDFKSDYTGIVFAGFGERQYFPVVQSITMGGVILDQVRHSVPDVDSVDDQNPSAVIPFAQSDMVTTFLEGINPRLRTDFIRNFMILTIGLPQTIIEAISDLTAEQKEHWIQQVRPHASAAVNTMLQRLKRHRYEQHYAPIHASLIHLPKDELANVAEALVNLNSFQKKVSMEDETVGGPIDVAVISKGDGLIWIKRKHYFSRELNEHYFNNLRRDQEGF